MERRGRREQKRDILLVVNNSACQRIDGPLRIVSYVGYVTFMILDIMTALGAKGL